MAKVPRPKSADGSHTRPMRSSPLAGPALNRSPAPMSSNNEINEMITTPPICHVSQPMSCQGFESLSPDSSSSTFRRKSITAGSNRSQSLYIPTSDNGHAPRTAAAEWEIDPLQSLSISRTPRPRPSAIPSFRIPIPIVEEENWEVETDAADSSSKNTSRNSSLSEFTPSRSTSEPQVNSWYTANTYDVTPRFSRLGLSGSTVVMPLSPKEHRRLSKNPSLARTNSTSSTSTTTPPKRFFIPSSLNSKPSPTPIPESLELPQLQHQSKPLSRTLSTASNSETSSITSNSQCETPTPISTSTSAQSLTRSRDSENDGEKCERDMEEVDGEVAELPSLKGHRDRDHAQFHYSDITITIKNDTDDDGPRPDSHPQSQPQPPLLTLTPPTPQSTTTNAPFPTPTLPKEGSLRKKLVRIKLQPVNDVDDLEDVSSPLNVTYMKTMTTLSMMTPITTTKIIEVGKVAVGLPEAPVPVVLPATVSIPTVMVTNSEDTLISASSISLPTPVVKKKRTTFRSVLRGFIARW